MGFSGFSEEGIQWLRALPENNNREWFERNKPIFEREVKATMLVLVTSLNDALTDRMPEYFADHPAKAIFRIYRDTRFSKDKTPYKTHVAAVFRRRGLDEKGSGLYFEVGASYAGIAGGAYMPPADSLFAIRSRIAANYERFESLLRNKQLGELMGALEGDTLKRPPKGFPADHPGIAWLKKKQFYFWKELPPELLSSHKLETEILRRFTAMRQVMLFLDDAMLGVQARAERTRAFLR